MLKYTDTTRFNELVISDRVFNVLNNEPWLHTVGAIRRTPDRQLMRIPNFGALSLKGLRAEVPFELREGEKALDCWGHEFAPGFYQTGMSAPTPMPVEGETPPYFWLGAEAA
jgi:hypothetical protein